MVIFIRSFSIALLFFGYKTVNWTEANRIQEVTRYLYI